MQVDVADVKCCGAAAEIQIPHADKFFAPFGCNLIMDLLEIIVPAHEGLVIVTAQAFDVDDPEIAVVATLMISRSDGKVPPGKMYLRIQGLPTLSSRPLM